MEETTQTPPNPTTPEISTVPTAPPHRKNSLSTIVFAFLVFILLGSTGFFAYQNMQFQKQIISLTMKPTPSPAGTSAQEGTKNWKTYTIKTLGLEFKLPPSLSKFGELKEEVIPGETGNQFCVTFPTKTSSMIKPTLAGGGHCPINHFGLGTTSINYAAGREGGFTDLQGFKKVDSKYFARFISTSVEIPSDIVEEIRTPEDILILKIKGKKYEEPSVFVYEGNIGALINTQNAIYPGVAIELDQESGISEKEFDLILSTFKFLDNTLTLQPADVQTPTAGICGGTSQDQIVTITVGADNVPSPRCTKVTTNQMLKFVNDSGDAMTINLTQYKATIQPGNYYQFPTNVGSFLAPGVHQIGGAEIWLQ